MPKIKARRTQLAASKTCGDEADKEWLIADFVQTRITKINGEFVTQFLVKWKNHETKTWEPMEQLAHCPLLFGNYAIREHRKLVKKVKALDITHSATDDDDDDGLPNFSNIPSDIIANFNDPKEYIPTGREVVMDIAGEVKVNDLVFWWVTFKCIPGFCYVRKCVMEYYFPGQAAFFHMFQRKQAKKQAAVVRANESK